MEVDKQKNGFLITCCSCIVILLVLCYFGISDSVKNTYALDENYYIIYNGNGATGAMTNTTCTAGMACVISKNTFTKDGCTFVNWKDNSGNVYLSGYSLTLNSNITLTAQWDCNSISNDNNVSVNPATGQILMFVMWIIGITAVVYSVWYFKNTNKIN